MSTGDAVRRNHFRENVIRPVGILFSLFSAATISNISGGGEARNDCKYRQKPKTIPKAISKSQKNRNRH